MIARKILQNTLKKIKYNDLEYKYNPLLIRNTELQTKMNGDSVKYDILLKENKKLTTQIQKYKSQIATLKKNYRETKNTKKKFTRSCDDGDENMNSLMSASELDSESNSESDDDYSPATHHSNKTTRWCRRECSISTTKSSWH